MNIPPDDYDDETARQARDDFDRLPSMGNVSCPDCGSCSTEPHPGCNCPTRFTPQGCEYREHINAFHHRCKVKESDALRELPF